MFILRAQPHAQSFFLFPINLIHFFDEKDGAARSSIVCFGASTPSCHTIWQRQNEECEFYEEWKLFRRVQRFWQQKVWTQRHLGGEKLRCNFLARKSAKLSANFGVSKVTSLPSVSLSLSLSLSHRTQYRKRFRASYNDCFEASDASTIRLSVVQEHAPTFSPLSPKTSQSCLQFADYPHFFVPFSPSELHKEPVGNSSRRSLGGRGLTLSVIPWS